MARLPVFALALLSCCFAAAALVAPVTASAQRGAITAEGPFTLDGEGEEGSPATLTAFESEISCATSAYLGEAVGGGAAESGAEAITATPAYEACTSGEVLPTTFTANGCDYVLGLGEKEAEDEYALSADIVCPAESYIVIDVYLSSEAHKNKAAYCTVTIKAQSGLGGLTATDLTDGRLTLGGSLEGIDADRFGVCEESEDEATLHLAAVVEGTDAEEGALEVALSPIENAMLTSEGPFTLDGEVEESSAGALTAFGQTVNCAGTTLSLEAVGGGALESGAEGATASLPAEDDCLLSSQPATITSNGCDYVLRSGEEQGEDEFPLTTELACPTDHYVVVDVYASDKAKTNKAVSCTWTIEAQGDLAGATLTDLTDGTLTLGGALEGIEAEKFGACGAGETDAAKLDLAVGLEGTSAAEEPTEVSLSPIGAHEEATTEEEETAETEKTVAALTSDGPFLLYGTDEEEGNNFEAFGVADECEHGTYTGGVVGETPHDYLEGAPTEVTVTPNYEGPCVAAGFLPTTIDMTGCDYVLTLGATTGNEDEYAVSFDLVCPEGKHVDRTTWLSHEAHTNGPSEAFCHVTVTPGTGMPGATATDETNGHITLGGTVTGLVVHREGGCAAEQGETDPGGGELDFAVTLEGTSEAEEPTDIAISEEQEE